MVEFGDVRMLQLTNVRLVRFSPYHRGNSTYRYLIDPSHEFSMVMGQKALRVPIFIKITELRAEYYMLEMMFGFDSTTYRSSEGNQDVVLGTYCPMGKIPNLRTEKIRLGKRKEREIKSAMKIMVPEKQRAVAQKDIKTMMESFDGYYSDISTDDDFSDPGEGTSAMARAVELNKNLNITVATVHSDATSEVGSLVNVKDMSSTNDRNQGVSMEVSNEVPIQAGNNIENDFDSGEFINFDEMSEIMDIGVMDIENFENLFNQFKD